MSVISDPAVAWEVKTMEGCPMRWKPSLSILLFCSTLSPTAQEFLEPSPAGPAALHPGLGSHHHPIATKNAEAQKLQLLAYDLLRV
jgi:hypothetical protein